MKTNCVAIDDVSHVFINHDVQFDIWREDWGVDENRIYEPDIIYALLNFLRPGDCCIDAGANIGYHTLLMSKLIGEEGEVIAFEPDPNYFSKLKDNMELNYVKNVALFTVPLWSCVAEMPFFVIDTSKEEYSKYAGLSSFVHYGYPPSTPVRVTTQPLDNLIDSKAHIRLIKIDCEGSEEKILCGAEKLLTRNGVDYVIVEFNFKILPAVKSSDRSIRTYMHNLGYDFFFLHPEGNKFAPTYIPPDIVINLKGNSFIFNGLFARRGLKNVR